MACGVLGEETGCIVQAGVGVIVIEVATEVDGRKAWTVLGREFTKINVESGKDIVWNDEPEDSPYRRGTAVFTIHVNLKDEVEEWMTSHGFEYQLIPDDQGNAGNVLAMFDLDAFLLFKLTWVGA